MLQKRNSVIIGLASITLFTAGIAFVNNSDNQNKAFPQSFSQTANSQVSDEATPTNQGVTQVFPPVVPTPTPTPTNEATVSTLTPQPQQASEQPPVETADVGNNSSQTTTPVVKVISPTPAQPTTQSIKVVPPTPPKTTTTKTRAS